ncbi:hypothetical protein C6A36_02805, partial [Desulfobacteraceae bacterium SEEP-SAG10]
MRSYENSGMANIYQPINFTSKTGDSFKSAIFILLILLCFFQSVWTQNLRAQQLDKLNNFIGSHDAILVVNPHGRIVFSKNAGRQLVPASVLKIFTALVAL